MFFAKYGLNGVKSTGEVPQRTSSHLATIVSRISHPQDDRTPCPALIFCSFLDNVEIIVNKICF